MKSAMHARAIAEVALGVFLVVGCKDADKKTVAVDARGASDAPVEETRDAVAVPDVPVEAAKDVPAVFDVLVDAPVQDTATDSVPTIDRASDSVPTVDARVGCPVGTTPSEKTSPCPAGAGCDYSSPLPCDAGCYGGSFVRFECINNTWEITRRTAGAPVCYCPPRG